MAIPQNYDEQLSALLSQTSLDDTLCDETKKHGLLIQYPAFELGFGNYEPVLEPPSNLDNREAPIWDHRKPGVNEARVMATFDVTSPDHARSAIPAKDESPMAPCGTTLNEAFASIRSRPGVSCLNAIIWRENITNATIVQLNLNVRFLEDANGDLSAPQCYQFGLLRDEWDALVASSTEQWVATLHELMTRSTERAYYHVHDRLALKRGLDEMWLEESRWVHMGGSIERQSSPESIFQMLSQTKI